MSTMADPLGNPCWKRAICSHCQRGFANRIYIAGRAHKGKQCSMNK